MNFFPVVDCKTSYKVQDYGKLIRHKNISLHYCSLYLEKLNSAENACILIFSTTNTIFSGILHPQRILVFCLREYIESFAVINKDKDNKQFSGFKLLILGIVFVTLLISLAKSNFAFVSVGHQV